MNKDEAIGLIRRVCAEYRGTLHEHNAIQQALIALFPPSCKTGEKEIEEQKE